MMNKEIRTVAVYEDTDIRSVGESRIIEGYGIIFNKESCDLGGFKEIIKPSAIEGVIEKSDVLALMNHDIKRGILARSNKGKGSMQLIPDNKGVSYRFIAPKTSLGNELIEGISRGDIKGSSFAFTVPEDGDTWERKSDGSVLRTVHKFNELYDMSPCYREAYQDTTIALRSLDEFKQSDEVRAEDEANPAVAKTTAENLVDDKVRPNYTNAELAMRARNEMYSNNI